MKVTGLENVEKAVNNLAEKIASPDTHLMTRLGEAAIEDIDRRFMTRGYNTWPALKPATIARKHSDFVLIETGAMYASTKITALTRGSVTVGVPSGGKNHSPDVPGYHQHGTRHTPQRKIIEVTPRLMTALTDAVELWVQDMIKAFKKTV